MLAVPRGVKDYMLSCGGLLETIVQEPYEIIGQPFGSPDGTIRGVSLHQVMDLSQTRCTGHGAPIPDNMIALGRVHTHPRFGPNPSGLDRAARTGIAGQESCWKKPLENLVEYDGPLIADQQGWHHARLQAPWQDYSITSGEPAGRIHVRLSLPREEHQGYQLIISGLGTEYAEHLVMDATGNVKATPMQVHWTDEPAILPRTPQQSIEEALAHLTHEHQPVPAAVEAARNLPPPRITAPLSRIAPSPSQNNPAHIPGGFSLGTTLIEPSSYQKLDWCRAISILAGAPIPVSMQAGTVHPFYRYHAAKVGVPSLQAGQALAYAQRTTTVEHALMRVDRTFSHASLGTRICEYTAETEQEYFLCARATLPLDPDITFQPARLGYREVAEVMRVISPGLGAALAGDHHRRWSERIHDVRKALHGMGSGDEGSGQQQDPASSSAQGSRLQGICAQYLMGRNRSAPDGIGYTAAAKAIAATYRQTGADDELSRLADLMASRRPWTERKAAMQEVWKKRDTLSEEQRQVLLALALLASMNRSAHG